MAAAPSDRSSGRIRSSGAPHPGSRTPAAGSGPASAALDQDPEAAAILFITSAPLGDAILTAGVLRHLHDIHPNARFTVVAGPAAATLFADMPRLERLVAVPKRKYGGHWLEIWGVVRQQRWDLVVDMRGSGLAYLLRARRRAVRVSLRRDAPVRHKVIQSAAVIGMSRDPPAPALFTAAAAEARAARLCDGRTLFALAPGATWICKTWPAEQFAALAGALLDRYPGSGVMLIGGADDDAAAAPIRRTVPALALVDLVGADVRDAYACLKRARLFVGNDSGPMHLAAAAGAPTLGLFGPTDERLYGPWGDRTAVVRARPLADFGIDKPDFDTTVSHMRDLSVDAVMSAALPLLEGASHDTRAVASRWL